jgi:hypothetical protein
MLKVLIENYYEEELLKADGFDSAVIGMDTTSMRLIYSVKKCIDILVKDGIPIEDAIDYFYYNVCEAFVGNRAPIWCEDTLSET